MIAGTDTALEQTGDEAADENPHYLRAVTELGEKQEIVVHSDIYAANGMKLLAKGARINKKQFDRLIQHKLTQSLDSSLALEHPIDAMLLSQRAGRLLEHDPTMGRLALRSGDALEIKHRLALLELPAPLPTRLTVMMNQREELFEHSLRSAMIAFAIGRRLNISEQELDLLLLAAICHDIGELHTDPALLEASHHILPQERRFIYVHPITGYVLLNGIAKFPALASQAVLQHHERLDGSGYPYGKKAAEISQLAKILAVAEVAEAVIDRFEPGRFDMLLRMNQTRFDPEVVNALRDLVAGARSESQSVPATLEADARLEKFSKNLDAWFTLSKLLQPVSNEANEESMQLKFLFERMNGIRRLILQAGFDPADVKGMAALAKEDPQILQELSNMLEELDWLLKDVANEIERRSPDLDTFSKTALGELVEQFRPESEDFHNASVDSDKRPRSGSC